MKHIKYLALVCVFCGPQMGLAEDREEHRYTPKDKISFTLPSMAAFDHSGKMVTHHVLADGSKSADHNGSLGNVTVARMGPDGKVETYCTTDADSAKDWMAGEIGQRPNAVQHSPVMEIRQ